MSSCYERESRCLQTNVTSQPNFNHKWYFIWLAEFVFGESFHDTIRENTGRMAEIICLWIKSVLRMCLVFSVQSTPRMYSYVASNSTSDSLLNIAFSSNKFGSYFWNITLFHGMENTQNMALWSYSHIVTLIHMFLVFSWFEGLSMLSIDWKVWFFVTWLIVSRTDDGPRSVDINKIQFLFIFHIEITE